MSVSLAAEVARVRCSPGIGRQKPKEVVMLILTHSQVRQLLPMKDCMEVVGEALSGLARGEGMQPLRAGFLLPDRLGVMAWMPGSLAAGKPFGLKVLSVVENPGELGVDSHQGGVMIFDPSNGSPLALCEAGAITAVRTAAVSALATDQLARHDATALAILGAGTQAKSHIEAMLAVRPIERISMWSRTQATTERVAAELSELYGVPVEVAEDVASAVADSDVVCTTTSAREPILFAEMLEPAMHINAVGASVPSWREIDPGVVPLVSLFTDRRESLRNEAGEYVEAVDDGLVEAGLVVPELGELLNGDHPGRTSETEITLFRSLGLAVEDIASAQLVYARAVEGKIGTEVDMIS
jgi:ornithine cyclodeaminase